MHGMASLEDRMRAELGIARGLSDVGLKLESGQAVGFQTQEVLRHLLAVNRALTECTVVIAIAVDQLALHTGYALADEEDEEEKGLERADP